MPRKRRNPKVRRAEIHPDMLAILSDCAPDNPFAQFAAEPELLAAWTEARDEILEEWTADTPGTRPSFWWKFDAPRLPVGTFEGCSHDGKLPEPRLRLGGIGTPSHERLDYTPYYSFGIPSSWITRGDVKSYGAKTTGPAIDPEDPPRYESQSSYLNRLNLLLPGEKRRLRKADFEPELIEADSDEAA